jgi:hypothetical protein
MTWVPAPHREGARVTARRVGVFKLGARRDDYDNHRVVVQEVEANMTTIPRARHAPSAVPQKSSFVARKASRYESSAMRCKSNPTPRITIFGSLKLKASSARQMR